MRCQGRSTCFPRTVPLRFCASPARVHPPPTATRESRSHPLHTCACSMLHHFRGATRVGSKTSEASLGPPGPPGPYGASGQWQPKHRQPPLQPCRRERLVTPAVWGARTCVMKLFRVEVQVLWLPPIACSPLRLRRLLAQGTSGSFSPPRGVPASVQGVAPEQITNGVRPLLRKPGRSVTPSLEPPRLS